MRGNKQWPLRVYGKYVIICQACCGFPVSILMYSKGNIILREKEPKDLLNVVQLLTEKQYSDEKYFFPYIIQ